MLAKVLAAIADDVVMSRIEQHCCSIAEHEAIKHSPKEWALLPYVGVQKTDADYVLEMRNCTRCYSTLAIERRAA